MRALAGQTDPLATLTALWVLQQPAPRPALDRALPGLVDPLIGAGILRESAGEVVALLDMRPYASDDGASGWVVSDLSPHLDTMITPMRPDFVLGVSTASSTLAQLTIRRPAERALDLGTGCGVQSLHLAQHVDTVVATDLNPRAIQLARLTAKINSIKLDLRQGDLFAPVAGEKFDLIVTNPPYVMSPASPDIERLTYREGHRPETAWSTMSCGAVRRTSSRAGCCRCWPTGPISREATGLSEFGIGLPVRAATPMLFSARPWTPASTSRCG